MTVVPKHQYSDEMQADRRYRFSSCPGCKAKTLEEASGKCQPQQGYDGGYHCPGDESHNPFAIKFDACGRACVLTNKSAKAEAKSIYDWVTAEIAEMEGRR